MPTYAYRCTACGHAFDAVQAFTDDALTVCPACGGRLRKLYGSVGVTFNGSGFYRTDARAAATAGSAAAGSGTASGSGDGSASSSSSRPAAAAASAPASNSATD